MKKGRRKYFMINTMIKSGFDVTPEVDMKENV